MGSRRLSREGKLFLLLFLLVVVGIVFGLSYLGYIGYTRYIAFHPTATSTAIARPIATQPVATPRPLEVKPTNTPISPISAPTETPLPKPTETPLLVVIPPVVEVTTPVVAKTEEISISIIYAPEYKDLMLGNSDKGIPSAIEEFNRAYAEGRNPITGQPLAAGEPIIHVTGKDVSSGTMMQYIVNAILFPGDTQNVERPIIWSPSVSHWISLANYKAGRVLFKPEDVQATGEASVVMAIWESLLQALQAKHPNQSIGWQELLGVMNDPQGWNSYGIRMDRTSIYYAHTDPMVSSTGLSMLIAEFYAAAEFVTGHPISELTLELVNDPRVQEVVHFIEYMVKHYWPRTTELKFAIAQGMGFCDMSGLEMNDLIYINQFETPPQRLVGWFPSQGTFIHEHPFAIPDAPWVSEEQRAAAKVFTMFVLTEPIQKRLMAAGFMPVNPAVKLEYPFVSELGVISTSPTRLKVPVPDVMAAIQQSWRQVKKNANILVLFDKSGSMKGEKLAKAKEAVLSFVANQSNENSVGLMTFSAKAGVQLIQLVCPIEGLESNREKLNQAINSIEAEGGTPLYDAITQAIGELAKTESFRTRAVVLLSDGKDEDAPHELATLNTVIQAILTSKRSKNSVLVIPIAYGDDADKATLAEIARASDTQVYTPGPQFTILDILKVIAKYF